MGHGSQEVYISYPLRLNVPNLEQAARMALTSACAVGSQCDVTRFTPLYIITPSYALIAPNGPPTLFTFIIESSMAFLINSSLVISL